MKAILIFLRHLADYIVGISYIIITIFAGFLIIDEYFPDSDIEVQFFVWVITASIIIWIFAVVWDCVDKTNETIDPSIKNKYRIKLKWESINESYDCKEYTIEPHNDRVERVLVMDWLKSIVPGGNAILVTDIK